MSDREHTPGPWRPTAVPGGWDGVADSRGHIICKLVLNEPANAPLLAAAPDLRRSLETVTFMLLHLCDALEIDGETKFTVGVKSTAKPLYEITISEAMADARFAIAKATGKEGA